MPVDFLCTAFQACLGWCWPAGAKKYVFLFFSFILLFTSLKPFSAFQSLAIAVSRFLANFLWLCFLQPFRKCTSLLLAFHETEFLQGFIMGFRNSPTATLQTVFARSDCACADLVSVDFDQHIFWQGIGRLLGFDWTRCSHALGLS